MSLVFFLTFEFFKFCLTVSLSSFYFAIFIQSVIAWVVFYSCGFFLHNNFLIWKTLNSMTKYWLLEPTRSNPGVFLFLQLRQGEIKSWWKWVQQIKKQLNSNIFIKKELLDCLERLGLMKSNGVRESEGGFFFLFMSGVRGIIHLIVCLPATF